MEWCLRLQNPGDGRCVDAPGVQSFALLDETVPHPAQLIGYAEL